MSDRVNEVLGAAKQIIHQDYNTQKYSQSSAEEILKQGIRDLNGGKDTLDIHTFRPGTEMFAFVEQLIQIVENEGLKGDEFFMNFVEYRNVAEGDKLVFDVEDDDMFVVSEIGRGNQGIRRQRLTGMQQVTVETSPKAIRVYEHLSRLLANRVNFNTFVQRVAQSIQQKKYEDIYALFTSLAQTTPGMSADLVYSGTYSEASLLKVIDLVEAENNAPATIIGTRNALRKLDIDKDFTSNQAKDDLYNMGYYGKFNGTDTFRIRPRFKAGTRDFIFPDNKLYVIAGNQKFIKLVTEGNAILDHVPAVMNMDLTQEYWYITQYGTALMLSHGIGLYEMA